MKTKSQTVSPSAVAAGRRFWSCPLPDTPENIARACMQGPPKKSWDFLKPGSGARREYNCEAI